MNRLTEWKRRINATQLSDDDKQKACDGLERIWATGEGNLAPNKSSLDLAFIWAGTIEGWRFWRDVDVALEKVRLGITDEPSAI